MTNQSIQAVRTAHPIKTDTVLAAYLKEQQQNMRLSLGQHGLNQENAQLRRQLRSTQIELAQLKATRETLIIRLSWSVVVAFLGAALAGWHVSAVIGIALFLVLLRGVWAGVFNVKR